jgi:hypothetical protein
MGEIAPASQMGTYAVDITQKVIQSSCY